MGKQEIDVTQKHHKETFPWRWFIFFVLCLLGGEEGIIFFFLVLTFVKLFTFIVRS